MQLLLESVTCSSGEKIKTLAHRIEQMARKTNVNKAPVKRGVQMNDAVVIKIANHKSTALEPQLLFTQLSEKIHQEDITRTHIDRKKIKTISTLSPSIKSISTELDSLTMGYIRTKEQGKTYGINVVRQIYSIGRNLNGKPLF